MAGAILIQIPQSVPFCRQLGKLCLPYNGEDLQWFAVDPLMSNMKRDGPECCQPLKRKSIAAFFKPQQGKIYKALGKANYYFAHSSCHRRLVNSLEHFLFNAASDAWLSEIRTKHAA